MSAMEMRLKKNQIFIRCKTNNPSNLNKPNNQSSETT